MGINSQIFFLQDARALPVAQFHAGKSVAVYAQVDDTVSGIIPRHELGIRSLHSEQHNKYNPEPSFHHFCCLSLNSLILFNTCFDNFRIKPSCIIA